jgi:hypothetical protein
MNRFYLFLFLVPRFFFQVQATQYQPWFGNEYEFELRGSAIYESYSHLAIDSKLKKYSSDNVFLHGSAANSVADFRLEVEVLQATTRKQHGDLDSIKLTGSRLWLDDVLGDNYSLLTGFSYIQAFGWSVNDLNSFHHGRYEGECFISLGKERSLCSYWISRWWGMAGIGIAEKGSPWLRLQVAYERSWKEIHCLRGFINILHGLGKKNLCVVDFNGYGSIRHRSIDVGLRYEREIPFYGSVNIEYSYRVYANNFPAYAHCVMVEVLSTFGVH